MAQSLPCPQEKVVWLICPCAEVLRQIKETLEGTGFRVFLSLPPIPPGETVVLLGDRMGLTPRQIAVLQSLADEGTVKKTARQLGLKVNTVQKHLKAIRETLGASSTAHALVLAMRKGLIR